MVGPGGRAGFFRQKKIFCIVGENTISNYGLL